MVVQCACYIKLLFMRHYLLLVKATISDHLYCERILFVYIVFLVAFTNGCMCALPQNFSIF